MPNQRSKDKKHLGGFVHEKLHAKIVRLAKREGMEFNVFGFAAQLMTEAIASREVAKKGRPGIWKAGTQELRKGVAA